jgi:hypothetical protein
VNAWEIISHAVAISGQVTDIQTDNLIAGARIDIINGPAEFLSMVELQTKSYGRRWQTMQDRPDRKISTRDGHFHFMDLPDGAYTLEAKLPDVGNRYGTVQTIASVSRDSLGQLIMTTVGLNLPPTTLKGKITDQSTTDPIVMAQVSINNSNESTYSDNLGDYVLIGLETGNRTLMVSARGYQPVSQVVNLASAGTDLTQNIAMTLVND